MIEVQPAKDIDDYLARIGKDKEKKKAKKFCKIIRDDTGARIAQVVVQTGDKNIDVITPMDCQVITIGLRPTMKQQEFQELNDIAKTIEPRMDMVVEKKEMIEIENRRLKEYIEGLNSLRHEDPTFGSAFAIAHGSPFYHEAMRNTYRGVGKWIEDALRQVDDFLALLVQVYDKTTMLIFMMQYLVGVWEDLQPMQEKTIPRVRVLKQIPTSTLF